MQYFNCYRTPCQLNHSLMDNKFQYNKKCLIYPPDLKPNKIALSDQPRLLFGQLQFSEYLGLGYTKNVSNFADQPRLDGLSPGSILAGQNLVRLVKKVLCKNLVLTQIGNIAPSNFDIGYRFQICIEPFISLML
jgi:hypothetical protein